MRFVSRETPIRRKGKKNRNPKSKQTQQNQSNRMTEKKSIKIKVGGNVEYEKWMS